MTESAPPSRSSGRPLPQEVAEARATLPPAERLAIKDIITEDDTPTDSFFTGSQRRLLASQLYDSWNGGSDGRPFLACANVGVFRLPSEAPLVPDLFLSLDVTPFNDMRFPEGRSYCIWYYGKAPDIAIEIDTKDVDVETPPRFDRYARFGFRYLVCFRPEKRLQKATLRAYELTPASIYTERAPHPLPGAGLGLKLWHGRYERKETTWLRWYDASGAPVLLGEERAMQARNRVEQAKNRFQQERNRFEQARNRAEQAKNRADRLAALLRAHGIPSDNGGNPDESDALPD